MKKKEYHELMME